jgi:molybdopterin converting factor subunit 1
VGFPLEHHDPDHVLQGPEGDNRFTGSRFMKVTILYFAKLKQVTQKTEETVELPTPSTVHTLYHHLRERYPDFSPASELACAVNERIRSFETPLKTGDVVCFIPPISGG